MALDELLNNGTMKENCHYVGNLDSDLGLRSSPLYPLKAVWSRKTINLFDLQYPFQNECPLAPVQRIASIQELLHCNLCGTQLQNVSFQ